MIIHLIKFVIHRSFFPKCSGGIHRCPTDTNYPFILVFYHLCSLYLHPEKFVNFRLYILFGNSFNKSQVKGIDVSQKCTTCDASLNEMKYNGGHGILGKN